MTQKALAPNGADFVPTIHHDTYPAIDPATKSDLTGKHVFITGASKGIGRATACAYAKAGAAAIGEIQDAAKQAGKKAPKILSIKLDVEDRASIKKAAKEIESTFGSLDILINNAGYLEKALPILDTDPDEWWKTWNIKIRGLYLTTRALLPLLLASPSKTGTILNLSSIGAHGTRRGMSAYQTTKLAVLRFSEFMNVEYLDKGVLTLVVHPGAIMTELASNMPGETHGILTDTPALAGDTIVYLTAHREAWLAGRYVSCTWDMPELYAKKEEIVGRIC